MKYHVCWNTNENAQQKPAKELSIYENLVTIKVESHVSEKKCCFIISHVDIIEKPYGKDEIRSIPDNIHFNKFQSHQRTNVNIKV